MTAFPHITKVFRFGPEVETNCHVRAWSTKDLKPLDLARGEGYIEFACFAEAAIAAEEFAQLGRGEVGRGVPRPVGRSADWPVARNDKLAAYWGRRKPCEGLQFLRRWMAESFAFPHHVMVSLKRIGWRVVARSGFRTVRQSHR